MDCNAVSVLLRPVRHRTTPFYYLTLQINCRGKSSDPAIIEYGDGGPPMLFRRSRSPRPPEAIANDRVDQM